MTVESLRQGTKFTDESSKVYIKIPEFTECYGHECNAVDIITGTMIYFNPLKSITPIEVDFTYDEMEE